MSFDPPRHAVGWPGIPPRWTSSAKCAVGTTLRSHGRVWFTLSHGILNEIYYPRVDQACTRDLGLIVADGKGFFSEEKRHARHGIAALAEGVPAFRLSRDARRLLAVRAARAAPRQWGHGKHRLGR